MDSNKKNVINWIEQNFNINKIEIEDFPMIPGGTVIFDENGDSMLVYWDIFEQRVKQKEHRHGKV